MNIFNFFKKKRYFSGYVYETRSGWGNAIDWMDWDKREIVGWLSRIPEVNDEIQKKMESGKIARFIILSVERCGDPPDMFFAKVADVGYVGESIINPRVREAKLKEVL